jgi:hypothetical protein
LYSQTPQGRVSEVSASITPDAFNVRNAIERLKSLADDPWAEIADVKQGITVGLGDGLDLADRVILAESNGFAESMKTPIC